MRINGTALESEIEVELADIQGRTVGGGRRPDLVVARVFIKRWSPCRSIHHLRKDEGALATEISSMIGRS